MGGSEDADALVHAIAGDWRSAPLPELDRALCAFASKLTHEQKSMTPEDLKPLRALGLDDRGIHDAVQVIALFNYYTRLADGLGVEGEEFIQTWGHNHQ